ncbi:MAG: peptidoglycan bridge formation glycyltransferase FemA/FemB family protein [Lachnospiraceae bacterium]|nr:peptidoglycan bridge formation glycyltransferase FemA/FemB family protein [Lachnospiraceae bacterium]
MIDYRDDESRFCYVLMMTDIAAAAKFKGKIEENKYFDCETPYGYGGPLCDAPITEKSQRKFMEEMQEYAVQKGIVSQFVRFHPLLLNHEAAPLVFEERYLHDTIYMDTSSPDLIMTNMDSKNRNMVRKAVKNGVTIVRKNITEYQDFIPIYVETMEKDQADDYYFFDEAYFKAQGSLSENACIFYAMMEDKPIAAAIVYYNDKFAHYHLAGTHTEYRKFAPSNLLLYETACRASEKGIKKFHLGGGITQDDNLFGFKKQFNKNGRLPFVIGRTVFDKNAYDMLLKIRKKDDPNFDEDNGRMIQYRA